MTTLKLSQEEYDALDADIRAKIEKVIEVAKAMNIKYKE